MKAELLEIIGDDKRVWVDFIDEKYYSDQLGRIKVKPGAVVLPLKTKEVASVVKFANENSIPIIPRGANTGLTGATIPVEGSIIIDLSALNHIEAFDEETLTVTVQPGVPLEEIQAFVETKGYFYPPDPGEKKATIGGNISTNAGGMRAVKYGVTRDYVRSLEVVLASGKIVEVGAETIKNSSGLDLKNLIIGSEGTLGIVTKAKLKVLPKPAYTMSALAPFETLEEGIDTVLEILRANVDVTAIEFLEKEAIALSEKYLGLVFPTHKGNAYLLFTFDGESMENIRAYSDKVKDICRTYGALDFINLEDEEALQRTWQIRGAIVSAVESTSEQEPIDIVVPIHRSAEFVKYTKQVSQKYDIAVQSFGHAGDGNVHLCIIRGDLEEEEWKNRLDQILEDLYKKAHELKGLPSGEHGIGQTKRPYYLKYADETQIALMRGIKAVFDPKGILNPQKVY
ncbi:2-hydroxy-acid oxidase [Sporanaerobium hydrogeniformans]|uniref:2-hydroxy-acid oxidase n=1 Tax=Sporanaerobium hydrogeniformans TaxID=3072179 RepID=A0AC61D9E8_9FIRM|nr:FAD-binding oxidoreductase [Sporanaerobium hydrogeniformans]PHV69336.1 2-hydroxy-acid oxidase [Sporanaerobium hydrogeniformans]